MDYEGPLSFNEKYSNITKQLSINNQDIITVVYSSHLEDKNPPRDKNGNSEDDLEWMRSDSGILKINNKHPDGSSTYKTFQLWLCLPKDSDKFDKNLIKLPVPVVELPDNAGKLRVVVGIYDGHKGPIEADSFDFWDMRLNPGHTIIINKMKNQNIAIFVMSGEIIFEDGKKLEEAELGIFSHDGNPFTMTTTTYTKVALLSGPPIDEPVMGYGIFDRNLIKIVE